MADAAADVIEEGGFQKTAKDLFSGAVGGIAQVLIGKLLLNSWLVTMLSRAIIASNVHATSACSN